MNRFFVCGVAAALATFGAGGALADSQLTLVIGGEAYDGSPKFEVLFDGVKLGEGTVNSAIDTANVGRFADATVKSAYIQDFTFEIPDNLFNADGEVRIHFLNEAYGGPDSNRDRNLYVGSVSINGAEVPASAMQLRSKRGAEPSLVLGDFLVLLDGSVDGVVPAPERGWPGETAVAATEPEPAAEPATPVAEPATPAPEVTAEMSAAPQVELEPVVEPQPAETAEAPPLAEAEPVPAPVAVTVPELKPPEAPVTEPVVEDADVAPMPAPEPAPAVEAAPAEAAVAEAPAPQPVAAAPETAAVTPEPVATDTEVAAIEEAAPATSQTCALDNLYNVVGFNENSNELTPRLTARLDEIAKDIGSNRCVLQLVGYSSTQGDYATNALFAVERAQNVLQYLRAHGVEVVSANATGAGETDQFGPTFSDNRRVVITVSP